jgi:hypothetical protein
MAKYLFELHQKWGLFLSCQLQIKDTIIGAAQTKLDPSYFVALVSHGLFTPVSGLCHPGISFCL